MDPSQQYKVMATGFWLTWLDDSNFEWESMGVIIVLNIGVSMNPYLC